MTINRVQQGVPTGGQFAPAVHDEAEIELTRDMLDPRPAPVSPISTVRRPDGRPVEYQPAHEVDAIVDGAERDCGFNWRDGSRDQLRVTLAAPYDTDRGVLYVHDSKNHQSAVLCRDISEAEVDRAFLTAIEGGDTYPDLQLLAERLPSDAFSAS